MTSEPLMPRAVSNRYVIIHNGPCAESRIPVGRGWDAWLATSTCT